MEQDELAIRRAIRQAADQLPLSWLSSKTSAESTSAPTCVEELRVVVPDLKHRGRYIAEATERALQDCEQAGARGNAYDSLLLMSAGISVRTSLLPDRDRPFDIRTLWRHRRGEGPNTFDFLRNLIPTTGLRGFELMASSVGAVPDTPEQLASDALGLSDRLSPAAELAYASFRQELIALLRDFRDAWRIVTENAGLDTRGSARDHNDAPPRVAEMVECCAPLIQGGQGDLGACLLHLLQLRVENDVLLDPIFENAVSVYEDLRNKLERAGERGTSSEDSLSDSARALLCREMDQGRVRLLINDVIDALGGSPQPNLRYSQPRASGVPLTLGGGGIRSVADLVGLLSSCHRLSDPVANWIGLQTLMRFVLPGRAMIREFHVDCIQSYHALADSLHRCVYRRVRAKMNCWERRLFLLMYLARPETANRVPMLDPVLGSFAFGMDVETRGILFDEAVFRLGTISKRLGQRENLEYRWRVFLRFYPIWLELKQSDEREQQEVTRQDENHKSLDFEITAEDGSTCTLHDLVPDERTVHPNPILQNVIANPDSLKRRIQEACSPTQASRAIRYIFEDVTQADIGVSEGVSQQAIQKSIQTTLRRLKQTLGLNSDSDPAMAAV